MIRAFDAVSLPLLRWLDPEDAHRLAIQGLRLLPPARPRADDSKLAVRAFGLNFPNPIGMAAGFDKNAEAPDGLLRLGFGFVEIGTVTPQPQIGNPRPRLFRLERDEAVVNRMGFNNDGAEAVLRRLAARAHQGGIVGVNVGANKDTADRVADWHVKLIEIFAPVASYFTVNVSSPNTPGLRNLQQAAALDDLLAKVIDARERVRQNSGDSPVLLKIAPDPPVLAELDDVVQIARSRRVDGMIVANTTLARPSTLREQARAKEQGGLSGRPLFRLSTRMVAETYVRVEGAFPLVGVGGIDTGGAALTKIRAGASLIQLYSSLVYKGLGLVDDIKIDLASTLLRTGRGSPLSRKSSAPTRRPSRPRTGPGLVQPYANGSRRAALPALRTMRVWRRVLIPEERRLRRVLERGPESASPNALQLDHHPITGRRIVERVQPPKHVVAHMGQYQLLRVDLGQMGLERFQAEVVLDDLVVIIRLGDEQISAARRRNQRFRPFGVGAVGDDAALGLDAIGEERSAGFAMHHGKGRHLYRAERAGFFGLERDDGEIEALFRFGGMLEQRFHHLREPRFDSLWTCDHKRAGPA